jgi:hypothetical protein
MKNRNSLWLTLSIIVGVILFFVLKPVVKEWLRITPRAIEKKFADNICLLTHDYAYSVSFTADDGSVSTIYLVKNENNQFDVWEFDSAVNTANRVYASAFITDSNGTAITSKYAVRPWQNEQDVTALKELFSKELNISAANIIVDGLSIRLTIQPSKKTMGNGSAEIICEPVKWPFDEQTETRFIMPKDRLTLLPFRNLEPGVTYTNNLEKGKPLYLLGFEEQNFSLGYPLQVSVKKLKTELRKDYEIIFSENTAWLPEGAPVFDADENLVGVYTQVNKQHSPFYISAYLRGISNNLRADLLDLNNSIIQKEVDKLKETERISDEIRKSNQVTDSILNSINK